MKAFEAVQYYFNKAADELAIDAPMRKLLITPERELTVQIPLRRDDGSLDTLIGYRVQHSGARGPMKGGLRYHHTVDLDEVRGLAALMSWKTALVNIPYGGAKGGVAVDPRELSLAERERVTRKLVDEIREVIGPDTDIPAPDMGTSHREMAWIMNQYSKYHGFNPGVVTGKPVEHYGLPGREEATGRGVGVLTLKTLARMGRKAPGATVAVQGFGNVGKHAVKFLSEAECNIVALSDHTGAIHNPEGIDVLAALRHANQHDGALEGFDGGERIPGEEILELEVDVLIPAAIGGVINSLNAERVRAPIIIEGANGPVRPEADELLYEKGTVVLPGVLANAGGVTASYFEWAQNRQFYRWTLDRVRSELDRTLIHSFDEVWERAQEANLPLRTVAYMIGIERVANAAEMAGIA